VISSASLKHINAEYQYTVNIFSLYCLIQFPLLLHDEAVC